jgi:hypothetical protein
VAEAHAHRPALGVVAEADDDVADPYRRASRHARTAAQEIAAAVRVTLDALGLSGKRAPDARPLPGRA